MAQTTTQQAPRRAAARAAVEKAPAERVDMPRNDTAPPTRASEETARVYTGAMAQEDVESRISVGFREFRHLPGCPQDGEQPLEGAQLPARMEGYDLPLPRVDGAGKTCTIVRCLDCGEEIRVD